MTPRDSLVDLYRTNIIGRRTNYCRVFLAKFKDVAAQKFKHFMAFFERQFNCRIHVLRTDGGGEYRTLDLFSKDTGIARQISEPRNQASNGKAERMHRTIMGMVRSMVFACGLPLSFWGDAAEYAAYILNRSLTRSTPKRMSAIEVFIKNKVRDVVAFSTYMTWRDTKTKPLKRHAKKALILGKRNDRKVQNF